jgi:PelA/Pel-15E family pectate lyase
MKNFPATLTLALELLLIASAHGASPVNSFLKNSDEWFRGAEANRITENVLSWQSDYGSWPKNVDTTKPYPGGREKLQGTFDNRATTEELRFLARVVETTRNTNCMAAFGRGLDSILSAQYPTGGWPQYYPPPKDKYHRHITFNDDSMVRLMEFLREVRTQPRYAFVDEKKRAEAQRAFDRGVDCILKCQIKMNGRLTAWCAQHDEVDLRPRPARSYELESLSGSESVGIVRLLMSLEKPSPEVVRSIDAAVAWFESAKLPGIKVIVVEDKNAPKGKNRTVVKDADAKPMWARFYELETNKPIFCGHDGVKKYSLAEIEYERRNGYAWLGYWPETLLVKEYPAWKLKNSKAEASNPE